MKTPGLLLPDLSLLLLAPLAVAVLGKRKRWQRWAWPVAGALLVVAVISTGTALADAATPLPASEQMMEPASHRGETSDLLAVQRPETVNLPVNALPLVPATRPASTGTITSTRVISYTYDPLGRLTAADYSTGERYAYQYDAGDRLGRTATAPR